MTLLILQNNQDSHELAETEQSQQRISVNMSKLGDINPWWQNV